jgi:hypothetical protein
MPSFLGQQQPCWLSHAHLSQGLHILTHILPAGLHIKMLKPCCEESQRLVDWVERGEGHLLTLLAPCSALQRSDTYLQLLP